MRGSLSLAIAAAATAAAGFHHPAAAEGFDGTYRGSFVCEKMKQAPDMLRAPFDMTISGKTAFFARPVFNRNGTRVVGSEIATGTVEDSGALKLTSQWSIAAFGYQGNYSGAISGKVGTLSGTQSWKTPRGGDESRGCTVAFVQRGS